MLVAGLTGGIGSGKSAATEHFCTLGRAVIDADVVAREVVAPGEPALAEISTRFGPEVLLPDGGLNRARVRELVFATPALREWLEGLLHPVIRTRIMEKLENLQQAGHPFVILASPLLLETDQHKLVDYVIVVDCSEELQISRTQARDNSSREQVERIMAAQLSRKARNEKADMLLDNGTTLDHLQQQVETLDKHLLQLANESYDEKN